MIALDIYILEILQQNSMLYHHGGGWLGVESNSTATTVDIGVFYGWKAKAGIEIGSDALGAGISCEASAELGVKAKAELYPNFAIKEAGIWVELHAGVYAKYWGFGVSGSCTIAAVGLSGKLLAKFGDKTQVTGQLSGYINILDIVEESFSMGFDTSF